MNTPANAIAGSKPAALIRVAGLGCSYPGVALLHDLSFDIAAGLTLVRGGDGRGKSTLLRLLAGEQRPDAGTVEQLAATLFWDSPARPEEDALTGLQWLQARRGHFAAWDAQAQDALIEGFGLAEHIAKPLYMLSTGSRRKVWLVAASACQAQVTLLDMPYAALDGPSARLLSEVLTDAAGNPDRAWVVADYGLPASLAGLALSATIDLGD